MTTATKKAAAVNQRCVNRETGILPTLTRTATQTEKIAKRTKQTKKILRDLPTDIVAAQPLLVGEEILEGIGKIGTEFAEVKKELTSKPINENIGLITTFREGFVEDIKNTKREQLPEKILITMFNKPDILKPGYEKGKDDNLIKWIYRIHKNKQQARDDDLEYRGLLEAVKKI